MGWHARTWFTPKQRAELWGALEERSMCGGHRSSALPMKLAMDTQAVIGRNKNATRILYRTNTEPGSSGSPCFTLDWNLVALHHYGDPCWQAPKFNQGVPIELIRRRIEAQGFANALGA